VRERASVVEVDQGLLFTFVEQSYESLLMELLPSVPFLEISGTEVTFQAQLAARGLGVWESR
jgi:hypothetical protein